MVFLCISLIIPVLESSPMPTLLRGSVSDCGQSICHLELKEDFESFTMSSSFAVGF